VSAIIRGDFFISFSNSLSLFLFDEKNLTIFFADKAGGSITKINISSI
jgi:hypothetical protein